MSKRLPEIYSELTKTSTALARLAVTCVLSAARRLVLIFVNPLYMHSSYFYFARAAAYHATLSGAEREAVGVLLAEYQSFKNIFGAMFLIGVLIVSVWLFAVVAAGKTMFPRAFSLLSPLTGVLLGRMLKTVSPTAAATLYPVLIPSFWMALLFTVYLLYLLRHGQTNK